MITPATARLLPGSPKFDSPLANGSSAMVSWYLFGRTCFLSEARNDVRVDLPKLLATQKLLGDLMLKFTAAGSVSRHRPLFKSPPQSIQFCLSVRH